MYVLSVLLAFFGYYSAVLVPLCHSLVAFFFKSNPSLTVFEAPVEKFLEAEAMLVDPALGEAVGEIFKP